MGLSRMLSDAPHLQCLREQLSACRQLALRAIWSLQSQDVGLHHVLLHDMVRNFDRSKRSYQSVRLASSMHAGGGAHLQIVHVTIIAHASSSMVQRLELTHADQRAGRL